MGKRGPKPLPSNVHLLRGNAGHKSLASLMDDFQPEVEIPDMPSWLWPEAKKEWKRIAVELEKYGLISKLDRAALVLYCQAWARMVWGEKMLTRAMKQADEARQKAEEEGKAWTGGDGIMVPTGSGGMQYSHFWVVQRQAAAQVKQYLDLFGLAPAARTKVTPSSNQGDLFQEPGSQNAFSNV